LNSILYNLPLSLNVFVCESAKTFYPLLLNRGGLRSASTIHQKIAQSELKRRWRTVRQ